MNDKWQLTLFCCGALFTLALQATAAQPETDHFLFAGAARMYGLNADANDPRRSQAVAMEAFDLDGDGDLDLVQVKDCPTVIVLAENRSGALVRMSEMPIDDVWVSTSADLVSGDVDGDGHRDLALRGWIANSSPPQPVVRTLLGDGHGHFHQAPDRALPGILGSLAIGDVDRDGRDDLLATDDSDSLLLVLYGDGAQASFDLGFPWPSKIALGDLDGDQFPDFAALRSLNDGSLLHVRMNDRKGAFPVGHDTPVPGYCSGLAFIDTDADGDLDVVTTAAHFSPDDPSLANTEVLVLPNDHGALRAPVVSLLMQQAEIGFDIKSADWNGDHRPDLAVASGSSGNTGMLATAVGLGQNQFGAAGATSLFVSEMACVDLDRDGTAELLTTDAQVITVAGDGSIGGVVIASDAASMVMVDFDRDGAMDAAGVDYDRAVVQWFRANGAGGFESPREFPLAKQGGYQLLVGDIDGDRWPDLIAFQSGEVVTLRNDHQGGVSWQRSTAITPGLGWTVATGDLNGDQLADIVLGDKRSSAGSILLAGGAGQFSERAFTFVEAPGDLLLFDLDGDAHFDLIHANRGPSGGFSIYPGVGDGSFASPRIIATPVPLVRSLVRGDIDRDHDTDLVFETRSGFLIARNDGHADFACTSTNLGMRLSEVELADLDGDGDLDLIGSGGTARVAVFVFANQGGSFAYASPGFEGVAVDDCDVLNKRTGDIDRDGLPDVLVMTHDPDGSMGNRVYLNRSNLRASGVATARHHVDFALSAPGRAARPYLMLPSMLGSYPGTDLGGVHLALNPDPMLWRLALTGGGGVLQGFAGVLDQDGKATARLAIPDGPPLGITLTFAFVTLQGNTVQSASNCLRIDVP